MTIYDRTLAGFSRRELMKIAWLIGAAAIAPPLLTRRLLAKPIFDAYPFTLGVASGDPLPDGIVLWTRLAPKPLEGGGMPMNIVDVDWEIARDASTKITGDLKVGSKVTIEYRMTATAVDVKAEKAAKKK